jgi:signal transduction histidine kinase
MLMRRAQEMAALYETSLAINAQLELAVLLQVIVQRAMMLLDTSMSGLFLLKPDNQTLEMVADYDQPGKYVGSIVQLGEGVVGRVVQTGEPLWIADYKNWEGGVELLRDSVGRILGVPLKRGERVIGGLTVFDEKPGVFEDNDIQLLSLFAAQAATAIENARLFAETHRQAEQLEVLHQVSQDLAVISSTLNLTTVLHRIAEYTGQIMDVTSVYICSYEAETHTSIVRAEYISPQACVPEKTSDLGLVYYLPRDFPGVFDLLQISQTQPAFVDDQNPPQARWVYAQQLDDPNLPGAERAHLEQFGAKTTLVLPLRVGGQVIAFVELWESRQRREFTTEEIALCQAITQQAAIAIENARLHEETRKHAQQLQQILDTVQDGIILLDAEHYVRLANPVGQIYLNLLAGITVGKKLVHLGGETVAGMLASTNYRHNWQEITLPGAPRQIFAVAIRPTAVEAEVKGWVIVLREVTKERDIQIRSQQQERLAAVGQLAAGVAHDFNNILTSIMGYAELACFDPCVPETTKEDLGRIIRQSQRGAYLIRQILDFSRQSAAERRLLDLAPLVRETLTLLERVIPENVRLFLEIEPTSGVYMLKADPTQIQQALTNLALNARDAMPTGGILGLRLSMLTLSPGELGPIPEMPSGRWIVLSVSDTGVGIPSELHLRIFEPFFTTKEVGQGTGLGLAQVYGIVQQHEGYIDVESQAGQGATFTIYLPVSIPLSHQDTPPQNVSTDIPYGQGEIILLVEDDPTVQEVTKSVLEVLGYQVLVAVNGREGLALYEQHQDKIALVLTDATMPEIGGVTLALALRQRNEKVKVIILTGYPLELDTKQLLAQGVVNWLQKPLNMAELAQIVKQSLRAN